MAWQNHQFMWRIFMENEHFHSNELLWRSGLMPSNFEEFSRSSILQNLQKIISSWIIEVAERRHQKGEHAEAICYGSYGLKVHSPGSDIDIIVIGPDFATLHDDFLVRLYDLIRRLPRASDVQSIPRAKVPLIKLQMDGISVDLCYVRVNLGTIPKAEEMQFFTLTPLDPSGKLALSSLLTNVYLSNIIPHGIEGERFRHGVRLIKFWAKRRGVYGNVIGYMGGIHWTCLFAFVYRMYPFHPLIFLLSSFFSTFSMWKWPTPVLFEGIEDDSVRRLLMQMQIRMPIQKPGSREFLHSNIKQANMDRILNELSRAAIITQGMQSIQQLSHLVCPLFETFNYAEAYTHFLKIRISIVEENDEIALGRLTGLAQSRFPDLINKLEAEGLTCDPRSTEYRDRSKVSNKVFLWGVIREAKGSHILPKVEETWKESLRSCGGMEGDIKLSIIPDHLYARYTPS